jgi:hypothetical protein
LILSPRPRRNRRRQPILRRRLQPPPTAAAIPSATPPSSNAATTPTSKSPTASLFPLPSPPKKASAKACRPNDFIPDLTIDGNRERWSKLELAKRRLLVQLDELHLKYAPEDVGDEQPLVFDFKASTPEDQILTGHADGRITINITEADTVERERVRKQMHEPHRTLIGHMRHEVGHYSWMTLVEGKCEDAFNAVFGDYQNPPYADALKKYYETETAPDWQARFVSVYATAHPWEAFAETWGFYFEMWAVLMTMHHHLPAFAADPYTLTIAGLTSTYQQLGIFFNEVNRTMGLKDLVPEIISPEVTKKSPSSTSSSAASKTSKPSPSPPPVSDRWHFSLPTPSTTYGR